MGKIAMFSLKTCPHCKRTKALLDRKGWAYHDISLSDYPERRNDMIILCDRLTVPQVFFNGKHLGGADNVLDLDKAGELDRLYIEYIMGQQDIDEPRLIVPTYAPKAMEVGLPRNEEILCVGEQCLPYVDMNNLLVKELDIRDRTHRFKSYHKSFLGTELVDCLILKFALKNRDEGRKVAEVLFRSNMFHHVVYEHPFRDELLFYRLQSDTAPLQLNSWRVWSDRVDFPLTTLKLCRSMWSEVEGRHTDNEGLVDYLGISEDPSYIGFQEAVCEFQKAKVANLSDPQKISFFINIYNLAVVHAYAQVGIPRTDFQRLNFFDKVTYTIAGHEMSLNDIENGILRANRVAPYHVNKQFEEGDPRITWQLKRCEPRIHFALNCGARSCPPVKYITVEGMQEELDLAAGAFMEGEENLKIEEDKRTIHVNTFMKWYKEDFGTTGREVAAYCSKYARGEKKEKLGRMLGTDGEIKLRYIKYDWTTNSKRAKPWDLPGLRAPRGEIGAGSCCTVA
mmetsp:Transcript_20658/g.65373  ORF Transcript_20658/g.65373 Transcript_20658/m.65373 type:complete len:509 (+) Transcript_20658:251-1777(+)|eukprot:CAMPEP_0182888482 /NCGR_PEP_ID=MMETSP0034_2-20130328/21451_1 /TAXON_ID=156128 /ORGANISM="Nephroselmis pyriformis, Strain CCMP717" /LENGTH=508 /DNA_ID=CAMNT_0025021911 /DNA_START=193 /DNA_END=1719 /DNA_ORIENTATION=+